MVSTFFQAQKNLRGFRLLCLVLFVCVLVGGKASRLSAKPAPPSAVIAGPAVVGQLVAQISWVPSTSAVEGYRVFRSTKSGGPYTNYTVGLITTLSFNDSTAEPGKTYYYVVTAIDVSGDTESTSSNEAVVTLPNQLVHLTWTPSTSSVIGYRVYRGVTKGGPYENHTVGPVPTQTFDDVTTGSGGVTYYYVVTALSSDGTESAYSNEVVVPVPAS
jgi:fibronectin type 3 domain-containing protein